MCNKAWSKNPFENVIEIILNNGKIIEVANLPEGWSYRIVEQEAYEELDLDLQKEMEAFERFG